MLKLEILEETNKTFVAHIVREENTRNKLVGKLVCNVSEDNLNESCTLQFFSPLQFNTANKFDELQELSKVIYEFEDNAIKTKKFINKNNA